MAANSSIEWTDQTWNPVVGCSKISPGCAHCYAETMAARLKAMALADIAAGKDPGRKRHYIDAIDDKGRWSGKLIPVPEALSDVERWEKPRRVFVNSMSDLFHEDVPDAFIDQVFAAMAKAGLRHTFQVLTKRAERMQRYFARPNLRWHIECAAKRMAAGDGEFVNAYFDTEVWPLRNVWLGISCEDQRRADERIPCLLNTPAAVRFLSCEPLLEPVNLRTGIYQIRGDDSRGTSLGGIHWVIVGGESGPHARPCNVAWVQSIVEQCRAAGVACFVKQLGAKPVNHYGEQLRYEDSKGGDIETWPLDLRVRQFPAKEPVHG